MLTIDASTILEFPVIQLLLGLIAGRQAHGWPHAHPIRAGLIDRMRRWVPSAIPAPAGEKTDTPIDGVGSGSTMNDPGFESSAAVNKAPDP